MKKGNGKSELALQAEKLAKDCTAFAEQMSQERGCLDVISEITSLALSNIKFIHIHLGFYAHTSAFCVSVNSREDSYEVAETVLLYGKTVYLDRNSFEDDATPLQQLLEIEDKLLELIAEAKDKLEAAA
ncbi:hypothetical protein C9J01_08135 [Photobacterium rosenbergii]|uniref:Uncharacterized protein n=1 Tax=Photobacterium rosenbergii TaxID=294936 RepID=A0A2T3NH86_9GAMM|nr:hypothetical protein [Photobacterium rosenbergii]PSW14397.1 hypothetical protein C9J01_08135 [Photobacterium rosenbergii]